MWRIAKRIASVKEGRAWGDFVDTDPMLPDNPPIFEERIPPTPTALATVPDPTLAVVAPGPAAPVPGVPTLILGKIKTSLVLDQGDDSEVTMPGQDLIAEWEARYIKIKGYLPLPEQEVTKDACAVMYARLKNGEGPICGLCDIHRLGTKKCEGEEVHYLGSSTQWYLLSEGDPGAGLLHHLVSLMEVICHPHDEARWHFCSCSRSLWQPYRAIGGTVA